MQAQSQPLISCLCVTRNKPQLLLRAIDCFANQIYSNKELIIVYEDNNLTTTEFLHSEFFKIKYLQYNIRLVEVATCPKLPLGQLRNISLDNAWGEYFCQWDDDDWYHPDRLLIQYHAAKETNCCASILKHWIMYDEIKNEAYISFKREWEGSILCKKEIITDCIKYPALSKSEDSPFIEILLKNYDVFPLICPHLYIYTFHNRNTWNRNHFNLLYLDSRKLSSQVSALISNVLSATYDNKIIPDIFKNEQLVNEIYSFINL